MADRRTTARNGYQDAADMAIVGRYRGPASSSTMRTADTDQVILASLEEIKEEGRENNNTVRKLFSFVREMKDKLQEGQRTMIVKEDKVLEALVRLKRPVHDDVEFERAQAINEFRVALSQAETAAAQTQAGVAKEKNKALVLIMMIIVTVFVGVWAILHKLVWMWERL